MVQSARYLEREVEVLDGARVGRLRFSALVSPQACLSSLGCRSRFWAIYRKIEGENGWRARPPLHPQNLCLTAINSASRVRQAWDLVLSCSQPIWLFLFSLAFSPLHASLPVSLIPLSSPCSSVENKNFSLPAARHGAHVSKMTSCALPCPSPERNGGEGKQKKEDEGEEEEEERKKEIRGGWGRRA